MGIREYLDNAIKNGKTVTIKYIKYEGTFSTRKISDIQYSDEFGDDYIQAFCHKRQEMRTFKISRILSVDDISNTPSNNPGIKKTKSAQTGNKAYTGTSSTTPSFIPTSSTFRPSTISVTTHKPYSKPSYTPSQKKQNSEGCYIATAVYGGYDTTEVLILRKFRDEILNNSFLGRAFIKLYYTISPSMAVKLKQHDRLNAKVKYLLDKFVEYLTNKK